ncbi:MAG: polysaccharide biosynthesis tyrosine autokinase [Chloroflexota bacterium]
MELKQYMALAQRWAWLMILGLIFGAVGGYLGSRYQKPVYQGKTKVMISRSTSQSQASDVTAYLSGQQLTSTYIQLLTTDAVLNIASERLGYELDPDQVTAQAVRDTQIIDIIVEDTDPARAAASANILVTILIEQNDTIQSGRYISMEEGLQAQKTQMENQIAALQTQIDQASTQTVEEQRIWIEDQISALQAESTSLQGDIAKLTPPGTPEEQTLLNEKKARLEQIQPLLALYQQSYTNLVVYGKPVPGGSGSVTTNLSLLQTTQSLYQQIYSSILTNLENVRLARLQNTPNVVQIEPATMQEKPVRPRTMVNTALAGVVGLMLAVGFVFLKEYLDDTLKTPEDIERLLDLSTIGYIAQMKYADDSKEELYVARQPRSPVSEAFRALRTNLEFAGVDEPIKTILVTSPGPGEGKTTIAANLAAIISQGGKRVILMDADLRKPRIHRILGIPNRVGLSDVFRGHLDLQSAIHSFDGSEGMSVITSGSLPPNPAELLGSAKMIQILDELKNQTDVVVIDCPPSLVADAQVLAAKVDAVLLVIQPGYTHIDSAKATLEQLGRADAKVVGAVLNKIPRERGYYYGGYRYHYYRGDQYQYYGDSSGGGRKKKQRSSA